MDHFANPYTASLSAFRLATIERGFICIYDCQDAVQQARVADGIIARHGERAPFAVYDIHRVDAPPDADIPSTCLMLAGLQSVYIYRPDGTLNMDALRTSLSSVNLTDAPREVYDWRQIVVLPPTCLREYEV